MPHPYPPEDERSPASSFAPFQPAANVVADDVEDVPEGGVKAADWSPSKEQKAMAKEREEATPPAPAPRHSEKSAPQKSE